MKNNENKAGFTLTELMVVVGVLSIVAGIVITSYSGVKEDGQINIYPRP